MNIKNCDYLIIEVNTAIVADETFVEIDFIFKFSEYTTNKVKLLYGINIPMHRSITLREWNTYACNLEKLFLEIPSYCLVSGYNSFNDMSQWILTYEAAKPLFQMIDDDKFDNKTLMGMKIAITNIESIGKIKKFHYDR